MKKVLLVMFFLFLSTSSAYAYLDLGNGSSFVQYIIGGIGTVFLFFKKLLNKIKGIFTREEKIEDPEDPSMEKKEDEK